MIKLKNIYKTYIAGNGVTHRALDNVSLNFEDKGFVVILGKSGSGKTTLLNLIAGLDSCERGEIIIEDRSFKNFKEKDYSSYRNSVIGYIFQDYNLIDAYNVYENIKLSLSLQSRKDKKAINDMMEALKIGKLRKRKNHQLSGGQKQRVAIARALIKEPKVLLADEPSGALDEKTTIEIFNILKELSKNKLVIVITHDLELANAYGDRIIEIKNGKVFKDFANKQELEGNNPQFIANSIYYFPAGTKITDAEMDELNNEFKANRQDYYLSIEQSATKVKTLFPDFKEAIGHDNGDNNKFRQYIYQDKEPTQLQLKKSKLPFKDALKLSLRNIWKKKFNFLFLSIISVFLLTSFGFSYSLDNHRNENAYAYAIEKNNLNQYMIEYGSFGGYYSFNSSILTMRQNYLIKERWQKTANYYNKALFFSLNNPAPFYISGLVETDYFSDLYNYPFIFKSNDHFNDQNGIILSEYLADAIIEADENLTKREELFDKELSLSGVIVRIVGIYQYDYQQFSGVFDYYDHALIDEYNYQLHTHMDKVFFKENAFQNLYSHLVKILIGYKDNYFNNYLYNFVSPVANAPVDKIIEVESFEKNYIYVSLADLSFIFDKDVNELNTNEIINLIQEFNQSNTKVMLYADNMQQLLYINDQVKISGFINDDEILGSYISDDLYQQCLADYYLPNKVYVERNKNTLSEAKNDVLFLMDNNLSITNQVFRSAIVELPTLEFFESFFYYINILIFIFLVIVLYFFLSLSIKKNQRQIGILRACGANFIDIIKIFILEALIIGTVSLAGGLIAFNKIGYTINTLIKDDIYTPLILDTFNTYFQMCFITLTIILLALILPIIKIIKTKITNLL